MGKKGVVKDISVHKEVVEGIYDFVTENGFGVLGLDFSPIKGPEGNIEYLIHLKKNGETAVKREKCAEIVSLSHENLDK